MGWFSGKKKKAKRKPPVLEPVGAPAAQVTPVAQPGIEPIQNPGVMPAVQAAPAVQPVAPAVQPVAPAVQPVVEVAPVGVVADDSIVVSTEPTPAPQSTGWSKKSARGINDIHKRLDNMMESKGKSLEERYADRFGGVYANTPLESATPLYLPFQPLLISLLLKTSLPNLSNIFNSIDEIKRPLT